MIYLKFISRFKFTTHITQIPISEGQDVFPHKLFITTHFHKSKELVPEVPFLLQGFGKEKAHVVRQSVTQGFIIYEPNTCLPFEEQISGYSSTIVMNFAISPGLGEKKECIVVNLCQGSYHPDWHVICGVIPALYFPPTFQPRIRIQSFNFA